MIPRLIFVHSVVKLIPSPPLQKLYTYQRPPWTISPGPSVEQWEDHHGIIPFSLDRDVFKLFQTISKMNPLWTIISVHKKMTPYGSGLMDRLKTTRPWLWRRGVCYCDGKLSTLMLTHSQSRGDRIKWCFSRNLSNSQDWFKVIHADKLPGWRQNVGRAELLA